MVTCKIIYKLQMNNEKFVSNQRIRNIDRSIKSKNKAMLYYSKNIRLYLFI